MSIRKAIRLCPSAIAVRPSLLFPNDNGGSWVSDVGECSLVHDLKMLDRQIGFGFGLGGQEVPGLAEAGGELAVILAGKEVKRHHPVSGEIHPGDAFLSALLFQFESRLQVVDRRRSSRSQPTILILESS